MEKWEKFYCRNNFLSTSLCGKKGVFQQAVWKEKERKVFNRYSFHIPQTLWKKEWMDFEGNVGDTAPYKSGNSQEEILITGRN